VTATDLTRTREALIERFARTGNPAEELHVLGGIIREPPCRPASTPPSAS